MQKQPPLFFLSARLRSSVPSSPLASTSPISVSSRWTSALRSDRGFSLRPDEEDDDPILPPRRSEVRPPFLTCACLTMAWPEMGSGVVLPLVGRL